MRRFKRQPRHDRVWHSRAAHRLGGPSRVLSAWPISSTWQGRHNQGSTQDCSRTDAALQGSGMPPPRRLAIGAPHRPQSRSEPLRTRRRMRKSKLLGQALEGSLSSPAAQDGDRAARRRSRTGAVARGRGGTSRTERRACGSDTCSRRCRCRATRLRFRTGSGTHPRVEGEENRRMWRPLHVRLLRLVR